MIIREAVVLLDRSAILRKTSMLPAEMSLLLGIASLLMDLSIFAFTETSNSLVLLFFLHFQ